MLFTTDQQTLEDLNIFGKHGGNSIYQMFNRTSSTGGALLLKEMFSYPLSNDSAINKRSAIIQYLADASIDFPFQSTEFDAIEPYLENTDERSKLISQEHSLGRRFTNLIAVDAETASLHRGVIAITSVLRRLHDFVNALRLDPTHPYHTDRDEIIQLLSIRVISEIIAPGESGKLSNPQIADYDVLFRFQYREPILRLLRHIYFLDVYCAVAKVAVTRKFVFAKALANDIQVLDIQNVYHPQVDNAIPNSLTMDQKSNVLFLTGANMAGKSTLMKSISIALFLAHMGFPIAASSMEFSVLDGIYTTINLPDNLGMGVSHFYAEVLRAKKMALELRSKNLFVLFDELFRGTNVKDACEATIAFSSAFVEKRNSFFVISTHIMEAAEVLKDRCPNINFSYLPTLMEGSQPVYTYRLKKGITADRHGMVIINNEGILEILKAGLEKNKN